MVKYQSLETVFSKNSYKYSKCELTEVIFELFDTCWQVAFLLITEGLNEKSSYTFKTVGNKCLFFRLS